MRATPEREAQVAGPSQVAVDVVSTSQQMPSWKTAPTLPTITMNGNPFPKPSKPFQLSSGWQLVVLDSSMDMTDPASVRVNQYFALYSDSSNQWFDTYQYSYNNIGRYILAAGNPETQLIILASFGWDNNAPPTSFMMQQLLNLGAGPQLQKWTMNCDAGSEVGWITWPSAYVLVGGSAYEYGLGYESYDHQGTNPATAQVSATLSNP
jgi:hypothetical protein